MILDFRRIVELLQGADDERLFAEARRVRSTVFGDTVYLRGVVEFSSFCRKQCLYCGLRAGNIGLGRYRLDEEEILNAARLAVDLGLGTVVLQSGEDAAYPPEFIARVTSRIKESRGVAVTLSVGDAPDKDLELYRRSGADRYLLKVETLDAELHEKLRPGETLENRMDRLEAVQRFGYEAGSGIINGLPGQGIASLASDVLSLSAMNLDMIAVGPLVPHPDTPLAETPPGSVDVCLRMLAVLRILNPYANIPATSALQSLARDGRARGLRAGCNVVMPSTTPRTVRGGYSIYPGKNAEADIERNIKNIKDMIRAEGLEPSSDPGPSPRSLHEPEGPPRGAVGHYAARPA